MLTYFAPTARLKGLVGASYTLDMGEHGLADHLPALLGQVQVLINGSVGYVLPDGTHILPPPMIVCGPTNGAQFIDIAPGTIALGIAILPAGWSALVGVPAAECADQVIDAAALWGAGPVRRFLDQVRNTEGDAERMALLARFLEDVFARRSRGADPRIAAVDQWLGKAPHISVDALAEQLELSNRQTARLTSATHGGSPKLLAMKYRALQCAAALAVGAAAAQFDAEDGYSDQSHLIRQFNRFVGVTPGTFTGLRQALARETIRGRWRAGIRAPIALWS